MTPPCRSRKLCFVFVIDKSKKQKLSNRSRNLVGGILAMIFLGAFDCHLITYTLGSRSTATLSTFHMQKFYCINELSYCPSETTSPAGSLVTKTDGAVLCSVVNRIQGCSVSNPATYLAPNRFQMVDKGPTLKLGRTSQ